MENNEEFFYQNVRKQLGKQLWVMVVCCLLTHIGVSTGLGVGAYTSSDVFGHTALMDCVLAYCQTEHRTVRDAFQGKRKLKQ